MKIFLLLIFLLFVSNSNAIINGVEISNDEMPYVASLVKRGKDAKSTFCCATMISKYAAITAAHCLDSGGEFDLIVNLNRRTVQTSKTQRVRVSGIFIHPDYFSDEKTVSFDLAIIFLEKPINEDGMFYPKLSDKVIMPDNKYFGGGWGTVTADKKNRLFSDNMKLSMQKVVNFEYETKRVNTYGVVQEIYGYNNYKGTNFEYAYEEFYKSFLNRGLRVVSEGFDEVSLPGFADSGTGLVSIDENGDHVLNGVIVGFDRVKKRVMSANLVFEYAVMYRTLQKDVRFMQFMNRKYSVLPMQKELNNNENFLAFKHNDAVLRDVFFVEQQSVKPYLIEVN